MRPQDLYPTVGDLVHTTTALTDRLLLVRAHCETWDHSTLRVDSGSRWTVTETISALLADLSAAEQSLRTAAAQLEGAWAALGRLSAE